MNKNYLNRKVTIDRPGLIRLFAGVVSRASLDGIRDGGRAAANATADILANSMTVSAMVTELFGDEERARTLSGGRYAMAALSVCRKLIEPVKGLTTEEFRTGAESIAYAAVRMLGDAAEELFGSDLDEEADCDE